MIVSPSIEGTSRRLTELLPTVGLPDSFLQWQAQLLSNYSGNVFVPHGAETSTLTLWQAVLESSPAQLLMQAEITELRSQMALRLWLFERRAPVRLLSTRRRTSRPWACRSS
jgi:hypothetical protein